MLIGLFPFLIGSARDEISLTFPPFSHIYECQEVEKSKI